MTDAELTSLAAKAYGNAPDGFSPLTDDGDALRLAVKLGIGVLFDVQDEKVTAYEQAPNDGYHIEFADEQGASAATRRAIVRAAAGIGKAMP